MSQADSLRHIADLYDKLEARCDELNEACSAKQVLIDNTASDLRDMRDLYEKESASLRAQVISLCSDVGVRDMRVAELTVALRGEEHEEFRLRVEVLEAALRTIIDAHAKPLLSAHGPCDCDICEHCRAALAQPAATGEGA